MLYEFILEKSAGVDYVIFIAFGELRDNTANSCFSRLTIGKRLVIEDAPRKRRPLAMIIN